MVISTGISTVKYIGQVSPFITGLKISWEAQGPNSSFGNGSLPFTE